MKITTTRRSDYGVRAVICIAARSPDRVKAAEIAEEMDIPLGFLHQVLQALQVGGVVDSRTGRNGGYRLVRSAEAISILNIIECLEGPLGIGECALRGGPCHWDDVCAMHEVWSACRSAFCEQLGAATLAQVVDVNRRLEQEEYPIPEITHRRPRE